MVASSKPTQFLGSLGKVKRSQKLYNYMDMWVFLMKPPALSLSDLLQWFLLVSWFFSDPYSSMSSIFGARVSIISYFFTFCSGGTFILFLLWGDLQSCYTRLDLMPMAVLICYNACIKCCIHTLIFHKIIVKLLKVYSRIAGDKMFDYYPWKIGCIV